MKSLTYTSRGRNLEDDGALLRIPMELFLRVFRIVFLDIDGVLNRKSTKERFVTIEGRTVTGIDRELVERLNRIVDVYPDVRFVMSSSWREEYVDTLDYLKALGFRGRFIGMTTQSRSDHKGERMNPNSIWSGHRGNEIRDWIVRHGYIGSFVSLDDDEEASTLGTNWIRTDPDLGISEADINLAMMVLL